MKKRKLAAVLGPRGSFSDEMANNLKMKPVYAKNFAMIFEKVFTNKAHYGLVPIKNTLQGKIGQPNELLKKHKKILKIERFSKLKIRLVLATGDKKPLSQIKHIYLPLYVLKQCTKFLKKHAPQAKIILKDSSSACLRKAKKLHNTAAAGSFRGAKFYKMHILTDDISDIKNNFTTFVLFSKT